MRLDPWACIFGALLVLTLPIQWLVAAVLAAAVHEGCHLGMICLTGGRVLSVTIGVGGARIEAFFPDTLSELLSTLAGPLGSLTLYLTWQTCPHLALWGLCQGLYNLLPIYPLDGGRILRCLRMNN